MSDQDPIPAIPSRKDDLLRKVRTVADLRDELARRAAIYQVALTQFTWQHREATDVIARLKAEIVEHENELREMAVLAYDHDPEAGKNVAPGVTIIDKTDYLWDDHAAIRWAVEQQVVAVLKLNAAEFRKVAASAMRPPCVTVDEYKSARLATDLRKALDTQE